MDSAAVEALAALSALDDPVRRRLYDHVCARAEPVARDEAAAAAGISRTLAAYHLDRLAADGLLTVTRQRRSGRSGPGAGRPAKLYARSDVELAASVPPRDYGLAALLLAQAADSDTTGATRRALEEAADRLGREVARETSSPPPRAEEILRARGYEPYEDADGVVRLRNCPFHAAAQRHPEVVCGMNLALLRGLLAGLGATDLRAVLAPAPGRCCVAIEHVGTAPRRPTEPGN
jgi:predicted ArsR family transcriptional regulator